MHCFAPFNFPSGITEVVLNLIAQHFAAPQREITATFLLFQIEGIPFFHNLQQELLAPAFHHVTRLLPRPLTGPVCAVRRETE